MSEGFFPGGDSWGFSQNFFHGGRKSGEICFLPLEIGKTTFFANNFKIQGGLAPSLPTPMSYSTFIRKSIVRSCYNTFDIMHDRSKNVLFFSKVPAYFLKRISLCSLTKSAMQILCPCTCVLQRSHPMLLLRNVVRDPSAFFSS